MFVVFVQKKLSSLTNELKSLKEQRKERDLKGLLISRTIDELKAQNSALLAQKNELKSKSEAIQEQLKKDHEVMNIFNFSPFKCVDGYLAISTATI